MHFPKSVALSVTHNDYLLRTTTEAEFESSLRRAGFKGTPHASTVHVGKLRRGYLHPPPLLGTSHGHKRRKAGDGSASSAAAAPDPAMATSTRKCSRCSTTGHVRSHCQAILNGYHETGPRLLLSTTG